MDSPLWQIQFGDGPLACAAIHDGHAVRQQLAGLYALDEEQRLREEDPFTGMWTSVAPTRIIGLRSRFEVDLNRSPSQCVYLEPEDAWGLTIWEQRPPDEAIQHCRRQHDAFYRQVRTVLENLVAWHGHLVVFDLHGYNHRRLGPEGPAADPADHPEMNIGTGSMDRGRWAFVVDRCIRELRDFNYQGRALDVRENVKFRGGYFPRWIHEQFPDTVCAVAIEVKKFFMDEWTGHPDQDHLYAVGQALQRAADGVIEELRRFEKAQPTI